MISCLEESLPAFNGEASHVRCFAHIINLVVKSILCTFESSTHRKGRATAAVTEELLQEDAEFVASEGEREEEDNSLVDMAWEMMEEKQKELDASVQPLRSMLGKVSQCNVQTYGLFAHVYDPTSTFPLVHRSVPTPP